MLTHLDTDGRARMVDVSHKSSQHRTAVAEGFLRMAPQTVTLVRDGLIKKGDVRSVAAIAGISAAKETSRLIPLCHNVPLSFVNVEIEFQEDGARSSATVTCIDRTGVEMEALTAVTVSLLSIYDMCKAVDKQMEITSVRLVSKHKEDI